MKPFRTSETKSAPRSLPDANRRFALVGAGALGTALALRLVERGYTADAIFSRTEPSALRLAERVGAPIASATLADLPRTSAWCSAPSRMIF